jgi:hypothetical protein
MPRQLSVDEGKSPQPRSIPGEAVASVSEAARSADAGHHAQGDELVLEHVERDVHIVSWGLLSKHHGRSRGRRLPSGWPPPRQSGEGGC